MSRARTIVGGLVLLAASIAVVPGLGPLLYGLAVWAWPALSSPIGWAVALGQSLLVPLAVGLARWDQAPTAGSWGTHPTIRGDVPRALRWLQTIDERLPGGLYEPTVERLLQRAGRHGAALYWIGWRNRAHGLRRVLGAPSTQAAYLQRFPEDDDGKTQGVREDGTWYWSRKLGPLRAVAGHRIYLLLDGSHLAVPTCTIKRA